MVKVCQSRTAGDLLGSGEMRGSQRYQKNTSCRRDWG